MTSQQVQRLKLPSDVIKQDIKASINAASISQVFQYTPSLDTSALDTSALDKSALDTTKYIIKIIRPLSRKRFDVETEVVKRVMETETIKDKSVRRFIDALIQDVSDEMNLQKESENMEKARTCLTIYMKHMNHMGKQGEKPSFLIPTVKGSNPDYIIMERVEGKTLAELLKTGSVRMVHYDSLVRMVNTYIGFIRYMNHVKDYQYILHADLHPGNIMFNHPPQPTEMTVIDWGRVVDIQDPGQKKDARVLLVFYELRQDYLHREDELLLACRMDASNPPLSSRSLDLNPARNADLYFYWLDTFYIPRQGNINIRYKFSNIYRWLVTIEKLINDRRDIILKNVYNNYREYDYKSCLFYQDYRGRTTWNASRNDFYALRDVARFMELVYYILRSRFEIGDQQQDKRDIDHAQQIRQFLTTMEKQAFQLILNDLLKNVTDVVNKAISTISKNSIEQLYTKIILALSSSPRSLDIQSILSSALDPINTMVNFLNPKITDTQQQKQPKFRKEIPLWATEFEITLPSINDLIDSKKKNTINSITCTNIPEDWKSIFQDMKTMMEDQKIDPLSDNSTFMRIFDAFQRLEQTLQVTWDKIHPLDSGSKKRPTMKQFLERK